MTDEQITSAANNGLSKLTGPDAYPDWLENVFESQDVDPTWAEFGQTQILPKVTKDLPKGARLIDFECRKNLCRIEAWAPQPSIVGGSVLAEGGPMRLTGGGLVVVRRIPEDGGERIIVLLKRADAILAPL